MLIARTTGVFLGVLRTATRPSRTQRLERRKTADKPVHTPVHIGLRRPKSPVLTGDSRHGHAEIIIRVSGVRVSPPASPPALETLW